MGSVTSGRYFSALKFRRLVRIVSCSASGSPCAHTSRGSLEWDLQAAMAQNSQRACLMGTWMGSRARWRRAGVGSCLLEALVVDSSVVGVNISHRELICNFGICFLSVLYPMFQVARPGSRCDHPPGTRNSNRPSGI